MLRDIEVSIGRTGKATPFAVLEPVFVGGSTVSHGHAAQRGPGRGQGRPPRRHRRSCARPATSSPRSSARCSRLGPEGLAQWGFPTECPSCGEPLVRAEGEADHRCVNPDCPQKRLASIATSRPAERWTSRVWARSRSQLFLELGLLSDLADIYSLDMDRVGELARLRRASVHNLRQSIDASRARPLANLLFGLNIVHLGTRRRRAAGRWASEPARRSGSASEEELAAVDGVGPVIASRCTRYFADPETADLVDRLVAAGVTTEGPRNASVGARADAGRAGASWSPERSTGSAATTRQQAIKARGGKSPGQRLQVDLRAGRGGIPGASKVAKAETVRRP